MEPSNGVFFAHVVFNMTLALIRRELARFLESPNAEVLVLRGKWGVGKSFSWNRILQDAKDRNAISRSRYAYLSLFGITSLSELKYSLFEQSIDCKLIGKQPSMETFKENTADIAMSVGRKAWRLASLTSFAKDASPALDALAFFSIRNTLVCLDDLERRSESLSARDILGLVSFLKEQRNCKVVILLNADEDGQEEFEKYREKVVDIELLYAPTADECSEIAFGNYPDYACSIALLSKKLNITNIRTLKKIERFIQLVEPHLNGMEQELFSDAIFLLVLLGWCHLKAGDNSIPDLGYVEGIGYKLLGVGAAEEVSANEKQWNGILQEYGFRFMDEFGGALADIVRSGYVDLESFSTIASVRNSQIVASKATQSFSHAWESYHGNFDNNQEIVVGTLYASFKENVRQITPLGLNGIVQLFRELGEEDKADELIAIYLEERGEDPELFNMKKISFAERVSDQKIRAAFDEKYHASVAQEDPREILKRIASSKDWSPEDELVLADLSSEVFYEIFKTESGSHLSSVVNACLQFGQFANASERQKHIAELAIEALRRIGKESGINALRVRSFGVYPNGV